MPIGTCKLCQTLDVELADSHLVPSSDYKVLEQEGACISVNESQGIIRPNQWSEYLLCADCEMRFHKAGENWVMRNCFRRGEFLLREALEKADPYDRQIGFDCYKGAEVPGIDPDQLAYFAASLFWRASCHAWGYEGRTFLGAYEEEFRRFLLGQREWPEKAWLTVGCVPKQHDGCCQTFGLPKFDSKADGYWSHRIRFLGVMFLLSAGNLVPANVRRYSIQHTSSRCIVLGEAIASMVLKDIKPFRNIEYKGKAGRLVEELFQDKR